MRIKIPHYSGSHTLCLHHILMPQYYLINIIIYYTVWAPTPQMAELWMWTMSMICVVADVLYQTSRARLILSFSSSSLLCRYSVYRVRHWILKLILQQNFIWHSAEGHKEDNNLADIIFHTYKFNWSIIFIWMIYGGIMITKLSDLIGTLCTIDKGGGRGEDVGCDVHI